MRLFRFVFAFCLTASLSLASGRALADIDHRCLTLCLGQGKSYTDCMPLCTYVPTPTSNQAAAQPANPALPADRLSAHSVFHTPVPIPDGQVVTSPKPVAGPTSSKDYTCFTQCLQAKLNYSLCDQQCVQPVSQSDPSKAAPEIDGILNSQP